MKAIDILTEQHASLDDALAAGWVRIRYIRRDGMSRILMATTNPTLYSYTYRRSYRRPYKHGLLLVWEHLTGWRALYRSRIGGWRPAS